MEVASEFGWWRLEPDAVFSGHAGGGIDPDISPRVSAATAYPVRMYAGKTLFAQIMRFLPWTTFARIVDRYDGDRKVRALRSTEHYRAMAFAQLTGRESLRDIEACLAARSAKLYHSGFRAPVRRSTLADANERRDWRIYAEFCQRLIGQARALYTNEPLASELNQTACCIPRSFVRGFPD